ncbi:MFS transporter [Oceanirhabdus sp. W0125-5]|uniref:MFS transporter n=1 Tax=Oceanirhabdus sp. W0125-5 TaxID=2999116 RepID=UPI0022F2EA33|nr:MFS transporter [Oceanirhabdus sp. W0125-5]WBW99243.1 MFS transporter [Oceanirhabdus sp. W0125-5]
MSKQERSWIIYDWACSAFTMTILTVIFPVFFKTYIASDLSLDKSTVYISYANTIAALIIAILAPFLGMIADFKGNKKKFFSLFLCIGLLFTLSLSFISQGKIVFSLFLFIMSIIGYAGANVFYDSFLTDITSIEKMDKISTHGYAWGYIGGVLLFIISYLVIAFHSSLGITKTFATKLSFILTAIWWLLFSIPMLKNVKQNYYIEPVKKPFSYTWKKTLSIIKTVKKNKPAFKFLLAYFFYIDGVSTIIKLSSSYATDLGIPDKTVMLIFIMTQFIAFPCAILFAKLAKIFSPKKIILLGIGIYTSVCIFAFFMSTATHFWIMAIMVSVAQGGIQALSRSYYGKLIPKENSSEFFGIYNIFGRFATILGPLLLGSLTTLTGNSRYGVLSLIVLFAIGGILFIRVPEAQKVAS